MGLAHTGRALRRRQRFVPGRIGVLGWDLEYIDGHALWSCVDVLVRRRWNDFVADRSDPRILDCGANIGVATLHYLRSYPRARVTAFEPDPNIVPILRRNLERNGGDRVEIVEAAVWTCDGELDFVCEGADGSRLISDPSTTEHRTRVRTVDLRRFLTEPVDLVKLDIEGAEFDVVASVHDHLENVKNLVIECHVNSDRPSDLARILATLSDAGFRVAVNSYGQWRDLVRRPGKLPMEFDQYFLLAAWRESDSK